MIQVMASGAKGSGPKGRKDNGDWTFLRAEEAKAVRELLRAVVARDFRSETQAATALGVSQSAVNQVLNENKAPGAQLTDALAEYLRRPIDNIRGRYPWSAFVEAPGSPRAFSLTRTSGSWPRRSRGRCGPYSTRRDLVAQYPR